MSISYPRETGFGGAGEDEISGGGGRLERRAEHFQRAGSVRCGGLGEGSEYRDVVRTGRTSGCKEAVDGGFQPTRIHHARPVSLRHLDQVGRRIGQEGSVSRSCGIAGRTGRILGCFLSRQANPHQVTGAPEFLVANRSQLRIVGHDVARTDG